MCVPCCDEYKKYGETKRARWKFECEQLEKKLAALRKAEDARPEFQLRNEHLFGLLGPNKIGLHWQS